ncbi:MAG: hypothetical protein JWM17_2970, partial [Actinobacteria bacterium]|nr:hypothetical protein [Actinomycetota bacterium]
MVPDRTGGGRHGTVSSWPTPIRLAAIFAAVVVSSALLFWATAASIASARSSLQTLGHRPAPQIVAAQGIYFSLSDMDAQVANYLLVGKRNLGSTEDDAVRAYNQDADVATSGLVAAANHATGSAERDLVQSMLSGAIAYQGFASHAEILTDQGDTTGALAQERQATDLMHDRVLPAATKLNDLALQSLNGTYAAQKRQSTRGVAVVLGVGLLLLSVLAGAQWFLFRRTRRLLNLGLVGCTVLALALTTGAVITLSSARHDLKGAKQDAFDSVVALTTARAVAYEANADESRYLIDPGRAQQYQDAFLTKSLKVV